MWRKLLWRKLRGESYVAKVMWRKLLWRKLRGESCCGEIRGESYSAANVRCANVHTQMSVRKYRYANIGAQKSGAQMSDAQMSVRKSLVPAYA